MRITRSRPDPGRDLDDEIEFYLEERVRELVAGGMDPHEAEKAAREAFGDRAHLEAECRRIAGPAVRRRRRADIVSSFLQDLRYAFRTLARQPGFTAVACITLALCIGANAAIFSIVNTILLQPLPYPDSDRLVLLFNSYPNAGQPQAGNGVLDYLDRRERVEAFEEVALFVEHTRSVGDRGDVQQVFAMTVTPSFFKVLGVEAARGRTFTEDEGVPGNHRKVVISHSLWQQRYAGADAVVGSELIFEGIPHTIVGVMPEDFRHITWDAQVWTPFAFSERDRSEEARHSNGLKMIARMESGATLAEAQSQVDALNAAITDGLPPELREAVVAAGFHTQIHHYQRILVADIEPALLLMWGGVLFVLLIGLVNITNLLMVRSTGRINELGTRFVLGANRRRIVRQLATEGVLLAMIGGAVGMLMGAWSLRLLESFEVWQIPRIQQVRTDVGAVFYTLAIAAAVGIVAGVLPGLRIRRDDLYSVLRAGSSTSSASRRVLSLRSALVALQVAIAFVLLAGAGLMFSSLRNVLAVDPGFDPRNVLGAAITVTPERYPEAESRAQFLARALAEIESLPGVVTASATSQLPFSGMDDGTVITPEGHSLSRRESVRVHYRTFVSPRYFEAMSIPFIAGRDFSDSDRREAQPVAIVDERLAELYWPGESAVGKRFFSGVEADENTRWYTVIGVVGEVLQNDLTDAIPTGGFYLSSAQHDIVFHRLAVRTDDDPRSYVAAVRERILALDPEMPLFWVQTMDEAVAETLISRRMPMRLLLAYAAVALFLSAVGIYGVLAYSVGQRTREIGIRMALGSSRRDIYRVVLRQGLVAVAVGAVLGLAGALVLNRLLVGLLYEVGPADPAVLGLVMLMIACVAALACSLPVRRATRVNPVVALNAE